MKPVMPMKLMKRGVLPVQSLPNRSQTHTAENGVNTPV